MYPIVKQIPGMWQPWGQYVFSISKIELGTVYLKSALQVEI